MQRHAIFCLLGLLVLATTTGAQMGPFCGLGGGGQRPLLQDCKRALRKLNPIKLYKSFRSSSGTCQISVQPRASLDENQLPQPERANRALDNDPSFRLEWSDSDRSSAADQTADQQEGDNGRPETSQAPAGSNQNDGVIPMTGETVRRNFQSLIVSCQADGNVTTSNFEFSVGRAREQSEDEDEDEDEDEGGNGQSQEAARDQREPVLETSPTPTQGYPAAQYSHHPATQVATDWNPRPVRGYDTRPMIGYDTRPVMGYDTRHVMGYDTRHVMGYRSDLYGQPVTWGFPVAGPQREMRIPIGLSPLDPRVTQLAMRYPHHMLRLEQNGHK